MTSDRSKPPWWCSLSTHAGETRIVGIWVGGWESGLRVGAGALTEAQMCTAAWQITDAVLGGTAPEGEISDIEAHAIARCAETRGQYLALREALGIPDGWLHSSALALAEVLRGTPVTVGSDEMERVRTGAASAWARVAEALECEPGEVLETARRLREKVAALAGTGDS